MAKLPPHPVCQSHVWKPRTITAPLTIHMLARTLVRFTQCTNVLVLLPANIAHNSFVVHTQESCSHELVEALLDDVLWPPDLVVRLRRVGFLARWLPIVFALQKTIDSRLFTKRYLGWKQTFTE